MEGLEGKKRDNVENDLIRYNMKFLWQLKIFFQSC